MHILSPETDNCPSWISGRERMTVENISWSISTKECCRPRRGLKPIPSTITLTFMVLGKWTWKLVSKLGLMQIYKVGEPWNIGQGQIGILLIELSFLNASFPAGTWRKYNVASTSMQRHDVASTLRRRYIYVMCLPVYNKYQLYSLYSSW